MGDGGEVEKNEQGKGQSGNSGDDGGVNILISI